MSDAAHYRDLYRTITETETHRAMQDGSAVQPVDEGQATPRWNGDPILEFEVVLSAAG